MSKHFMGGGGGALYRMPQSLQSVPYVQTLDVASLPPPTSGLYTPSSQKPLLIALTVSPLILSVYMQLLSQYSLL